MDLLRSCTSGVHIIDGFASVPFKVYALDKTVESTKRTCAARWDLLDTEYNARKTGQLVTTDLKKLHLWVFEKPKSLAVSSSPATATETTEPFEPPLESDLRCIHTGDFRPLQLRGAASSVRPGDQENFSVAETFRCFVRACLRSISFQLAAEQHITPLNTHAFIFSTSPHGGPGSPSNSKSSSPSSHRIVTLKIELLEQGYLQVAATCSRLQNLHCLADSQHEKRVIDELDHPSLVFVAPSSRLARTSWRDDLLSKFARPTAGSSASYKSAEWVFSEPQGSIWKTLVVQWLRWQGLDFRDRQGDDDWVQVTVFLRFPHSEDATPRSRLLTDRLTLTWPAQLCFMQDVIPNRDIANVSSTYEIRGGIEWFQYGSHKGFVDTLQAAISWMENKTQLENELETRRRSRLVAEQVKPATQDVTVDLFDPQSPLDGRTMSYHEAQAIYPTPSDGLPAHVTPGSTSFENGAFPSSAHHDAGSSPDVEINHTEIKDSGLAGMQNLVPDQTYGGEDHYFGSTALTDADFDFFDQPALATTNEQLEDMEVDDHNFGTTTSSDGHLPDDTSPATDAPKKPADSMRTLTDLDMNAREQSHPLTQDPDDQTIRAGIAAEQGSMDLQVRNTEEQNKQQDLRPSSNPVSMSKDGTQTDLIQLANVETESPHNSTLNNGDRGLQFDDHKYLNDGRFGFQPRKRPRRASISHASARKLERHRNVFTSPTSITKTATVTSAKQFHYSKASTDDELSTDSDSVSSRSDVRAPSSRKQPNISSTNHRPNLLSVDSNGNFPQGRLASAVSGRSGNQKYWSIEDFDALAETMLMGYFKSSSTNWSLTHFLATDEAALYLDSNRETEDSRDEIGIAQILADQLSRGVSLPKISDRPKEQTARVESQDDDDISSLSCVNEAISKIFPHSISKTQDLFHFMSSPDADDDDEGEEAEIEMNRINSAQVRLQRSRADWDFASSAPAFWETLGLEPSHGPKQMTAFCVYPWSKEIEASIDSFLETMESTWLSQKLGSHKAGDSVGDDKSGHAPVTIEGNESEKISTKEALAAFSNSCRELGQRLKAARDSEQRIIIYMINPFEAHVAMEALCRAFWTLTQAYSEDDEAQLARNISLQVLPIALIASVEAPVFIEPETANSIAHRVYDNCSLNEAALDLADLPVPSGASIILAKPVPQAIQFQLSSTPSSNVLEENSRLHVAYCESPDRRWAAVTWTDDTGEYQHSASYHLAGVGIGGSVIKEMWETTLEIIKPRKVNWRLFIVKCGLLNPHEHKIWHSLATHSAGTSHKLSLISVNTSPALTIGIKPAIHIALMETAAPTANTFSTPVTTPHPQQIGSSPAPSSPTNAATIASTPSALPSAEQAAAAEADQAARLIDKTDESWGIVLPRCLNAAESVVDYNPALASGYLMKRTGAGELDPPVLMEVNLMHSQEVEAAVGAGADADDVKRQAHAKLLAEVLVMYRNLGLLARLRRVEGRQSCTPWHIAVAMRAAEGLGRCMNW